MGMSKDNPNSNQKSKKMKCMWCDTIFSHAHATRMLSHVQRVKGPGVQAHKGKISLKALKSYMLLFQNGKGKADSRKWVLNNVVESVDVIQQSTACRIVSSIFLQKAIYRPSSGHQSNVHSSGVWADSISWYLSIVWFKFCIPDRVAELN